MKPVKVKIVFEDGSEEEFGVFAGIFGNPSERARVLYRLPSPSGWEGFWWLSNVAGHLRSLELEIRARAEELVPKYGG